MTTESPALFIDTEMLLMRAATACEFEMEWDRDVWQYFCNHANARVLFQDLVADVRSLAPHHRPVLALSAKASFRYGVWPSYKANRKRRRKPCGYPALIEWLWEVADARQWFVETLRDVEADDVMGVLAAPENGDVVASDDKDMLTIPGQHLRNGQIVVVSRLAADLAFYSQVLVGDASDNYPGCPGVGEAGAAKALAGCQTEAEMWDAVLSLYLKKGLVERDAITQARCARILRPGEYDQRAGVPLLWVPPVG
jgi:DNA polymerase-1